MKKAVLFFVFMIPLCGIMAAVAMIAGRHGSALVALGYFAWIYGIGAFLRIVIYGVEAVFEEETAEIILLTWLCGSTVGVVYAISSLSMIRGSFLIDEKEVGAAIFNYLFLAAMLAAGLSAVFGPNREGEGTKKA